LQLLARFESDEHRLFKFIVHLVQWPGFGANPTGERREAIPPLLPDLGFGEGYSETADGGASKHRHQDCNEGCFASLVHGIFIVCFYQVE
jgi:hypothetical protein